VIASETRDPSAVSAETRAGVPVTTPWTLRAIYVLVGLSTASVAPFVAVILKERGLNSAEIGVVAALGALSATIIVPVWGHLADAVVGRKRAFRIGLVMASGTAVGLLANLPIVAVAAMLASFGVYYNLFFGLADAMAVSDLPAPERQYGALRAHASLSFTLGIVAVGFIYSWAGYGAAPAVFLVWSVLLLVLVGRIPDHRLEVKVPAMGRKAGGVQPIRFGSPGRAMAVQPRLWVILAVFALAFVGLQASMLFVGIRIVELGGRPLDVAISPGVAAIAEIPGLVAAGWLGRRIGLRWLFVLSLVLYGLAIASWGVLPDALAINATRVVTGLCYGALMASRVLMVPRLLPRSLQATGQVLFTAATLGFGSVVGSVIGGIVYGWAGPTLFFAAAGGVAIAGGLASWFVLAGPVGERLAASGSIPFEMGEPSGGAHGASA
jgi:PPP family 3-phenylpropionic acid transporter